MKKLGAALIVFSLLIASIGVTKSLAQAANSENIEAISQEAERNRELLEIWKDHVKTLTKERDTAYKEIEHLKSSRPANPASSSAPMAQFGGIETQSFPAPDAGRMQSMQSEIESLRGQLARQKPTMSGSDRETQMQLSAMQSQLSQVKKDLAEANREKDRLIQEKEKALSQVERLSAEKTSTAPAPAGDAVAQSLQKALDIQKQRNVDLQNRYSELESQMETLRQQKESESSSAAMQSMLKDRQRDQIKLQGFEARLQELRDENERLRSQSGSGSGGSISASDEQAVREARRLQYENNTLRAKTERLQAVEKELQSTRNYFMPLVDELQKKDRALTDDNQNMKAQMAKWQSDMDEISHRAERSAVETQGLRTQVASARSEIDESAKQISALKSQLQIAEADKDKYQGMDEELQKLRTENRALVASKSEFEANSHAFEEQVRSSAAELDSLRKENESLKNRDQKSSKQIEALRVKLRSGLTDMKNLKSNFESYLDSLITGFDDRQKNS